MHFNEISNKEKAAPAFMFVQTATGYRPATVSDFGGGGGGGQTPILYNNVFGQITSGNFSIPIGVISWSIAVESGSAIINGLQLNEGTSVNGGGFDQSTLASTINIGCTGGRVIYSYSIGV